MYSRLLQPPQHQSFFLFGPRGADYPSSQAYLLHLGKRSWHERGVDLMPFDTALKRITELL
ncbi:MAG: hypothetical protein IT514_14300 [Burkholderiales bacterium]|nr:hypothetical protein [Burkholderiales bacterium]